MVLKAGALAPALVVFCASVALTYGLPQPAASARPANQATPGGVRGRVHFTEPSGAIPGRPNVGDLGGSDTHVVDQRRSVVYFDSVPRQAFEELPVGRPRMDQRNEEFVPRVLAITVGTIVDFPNSDTKFHNVFSLSKTHPFDLGRYPPGKTGFQRFDRPGLVRVFCDIHSHMSGYIWVFSHRYFAVTDTDGRFAITDVPAGAYTLVLWSEVGTADPRRVIVSDGTITDVDFRVGRTQ